MKTRMEKYYSDSSGARSEKNRQLYNEVTEDEFYTELGTLDSNNEIDISKVKEILKNREDYQRAKQYRELLGEKIKPFQKESTSTLQEDKIYDINQIIEEAKQNRQQDEEACRKITNTEYDILGKLDIDDLERQAQELLEKNKKEELELKELINTISSQTLAKKTKEALALDLLTDLKETTITTAAVVTEEEVEDHKEEVDNSFFTTSSVFDKNDFEDIENQKESKKVDNVLVNFLIFLVIVIVLILVAFLVKSLL